MAKGPTQADRVRGFAGERRVFTRAEIIAALGASAAGALNQMVGGEVVRQAVGVYSLPGILPSDARVAAKIEEAGARPLTDEDRARDAVKAEERAAQALGAKARSGGTVSVVGQVEEHFARNPVASAADLKRSLGNSAATAAKTLVERGVLERVRDGLWTRAGVAPFGPEMRAYVERHSVELAAVRREIEQVAEADATISDGGAEIEWSVSRAPGRSTKVYMNMTNVPSVWAQGRGGKLSWYAVRGLVSPLAAEHIARMVLNPMPERIGELADLVDSGKAPTGVRRRHGLYRDYQRPEEAEPEHQEHVPRGRGYGINDTHVLDPRRLGNGIPEPVTLEIDDREDDRLVTILTGVPNLHIMTTRLEMADFVARHDGRDLAIERKTTADLVASIEDNRLAEQVHRMSQAGMPCFFVIEGGMTAIRTQPLPRLASLQTRLNFGMDMRVLETIDLQHTAYVIVTAIRDHFFGTGSAFDLKPVKIPGIGDVERAQFMLQSIPGISPIRASALIKRFGSIANVARASVKEIATIDGIGGKTAATLHAVLHAGEDPTWGPEDRV